MKKKQVLIISAIGLTVLLTVILLFIFVFNNKSYTVEFNTDGGTPIESITIKKGKTVQQPTNPTKEGYVFIGWSLDGNEFNFSTPIKNDITLKAEWKKEIHVTLIYNNGNPNETITVKQGDLLKVKEPTKKGCKFFGWQTDKKQNFNLTEPINEDITLTAIYKNIYTVTFISDGQQIQKTEVIEGEKVKQPTIEPSKKGYEFRGWLLNNAPFDFNKPITENIELKADFQLIPIEPTSVAFNQTVYKIKKGDTISTNTLFTPSDANSKIGLTYSSDNEQVATIDKYGTIKAISGGKATITVTSENGKSATAIVYVNDEYIFASWNAPTQEILNFYIDSEGNVHHNTATIHHVKFENGQRSERNITAENGLKLILDNYNNCLDISFTTSDCTVTPLSALNELTTTVTCNAYFSFEQLKSDITVFRIEPTLKVITVQSALEYSQNDIKVGENGKASLTVNCSGSFNISENIDLDNISGQTIEFTLSEQAEENGYIYFTSVCGQTITITIHR